MKIAAVVILYHPDDRVLANIKTYYDYVDKIYVFDNTEEESPLEDSLKKLPKVIFQHDYDNRGIAKRLNEACTIALQQQFDWLLTMDQDSGFSTEAIATYFTCFQQYKNYQKVALFGTSFSGTGNITSYDCHVEEVDKLITSGSLLNLSLVKEIGGFDEALFIDAVDYDYCIRAKIAGFSLIQFSNIYISHSIGKEVYTSSIKSFFLLKKKKLLHSPLRIYYMYRNMLYLKRKYENEDKKYYAIIRSYVHTRIKVCLYYGRDTLNIIKYLLKGRSDFKNNNMGKINKT